MIPGPKEYLIDFPTWLVHKTGLSPTDEEFKAFTPNERLKFMDAYAEELSILEKKEKTGEIYASE